jgi:hypothetical protein
MNSTVQRAKVWVHCPSECAREQDVEEITGFRKERSDRRLEKM